MIGALVGDRANRRAARTVPSFAVGGGGVVVLPEIDHGGDGAEGERAAC